MNTSHPIASLELKPHFSSDKNESTAFPSRMRFHWPVMRSQSVSEVVNMRTLHPGLSDSPRPTTTTRSGAQCLVAPSQLTGFNDYNDHSSTDKLQATATPCAAWKMGADRAAVRRGEVVAEAEITFLQCSRQERQAQLLQGPGAAFLTGKEVSEGGQSERGLLGWVGVYPGCAFVLEKSLDRNINQRIHLVYSQDPRSPNTNMKDDFILAVPIQSSESLLHKPHFFAACNTPQLFAILSRITSDETWVPDSEMEISNLRTQIPSWIWGSPLQFRLFYSSNVLRLKMFPP